MLRIFNLDSFVQTLNILTHTHAHPQMRFDIKSEPPTPLVVLIKGLIDKGTGLWLSLYLGIKTIIMDSPKLRYIKGSHHAIIKLNVK